MEKDNGVRKDRNGVQARGVRTESSRRRFLRLLGIGATGAAVLPGISLETAAKSKSRSKKSKEAGDDECAIGPFTKTYTPTRQRTGSVSDGEIPPEDVDEGDVVDIEEKIIEEVLEDGSGELEDVEEVEAEQRRTDQDDTTASTTTIPGSLSDWGQSISIESEFEGPTDPGWNPSDVNIAAGPNHLVVTLNARWFIYSKDGQLRAAFSLQEWFDVDSEFLVDPWVRYDAESERFYLLVLYYDVQTETGSYLLSVSDDSNPVGTWYNYQFSPIGEQGWLDFPSLGFDSEALYISYNYWEGTQYEGSTLTVLDKEPLSRGEPVTATEFQELRNPDGTFAFSVRPAEHSAIDVEQDRQRPYYLLNSYTDYTFEDGEPRGIFTLWTVENPLNDPSLDCQRVDVPLWAWTVDSPQPESNTLIDTGFEDLLTVAYDEDDDTLWTAQTVGKDWNDDGEVVSAIQWFEVDPERAELVQNGLWGEPGKHYYFPAVNTTAEGMQMCYNVSGPETFVRMEIAGRTDDFQQGEIEDRVVVEDGASPYEPASSDESVRWGDYYSVSIDPETDTFWSVSQYSPPEDPSVENDLYATRIAETSFGTRRQSSRNEIARAKYGLEFDDLSVETTGQVQGIFNRQPFPDGVTPGEIRTREEIAEERFDLNRDVGEEDLAAELTREQLVDVQNSYDAQFGPLPDDPAYSPDEIARAKYGLDFDELSVETTGQVRAIYNRQPFPDGVTPADIRTREEIAEDWYGLHYYDLDTRERRIDVENRYDDQFGDEPDS